MKVAKLAILNTAEGRLRVVSALVLAPIVLVLGAIGGPAYAGLITLVTMTGLFEWLRLVDPAAPLPDCAGMYAALLLVMILTMVGLPVFAVITILMASAAFYAHRSNIDPPRAVWFALGLPYMAGSGLALVYLRDIPASGLGLTAYLVACVWGMDIGAYVVGRLLGGPKLAPTISPNKTWSGFIGGLVLAMMLASVVLIVSGARSFYAWLFFAAILAAISQGGDLFKSFFKRRAGVKDCGNIIPGHGGVLDRIDGLVFAALALAFLHAVFGLGMIW